MYYVFALKKHRGCALVKESVLGNMTSALRRAFLDVSKHQNPGKIPKNLKNGQLDLSSVGADVKTNLNFLGKDTKVR